MTRALRMAGASTARPSERTTKRFIFFAETDAGATGGLQRAKIQTLHSPTRSIAPALPTALAGCVIIPIPSSHHDALTPSSGNPTHGILITSSVSSNCSLEDSGIGQSDYGQQSNKGMRSAINSLRS